MQNLCLILIKGIIKDNVFAVYLSKHPNDGTSEITFGGYNKDIMANNEISWHNVVDPNKWVINVAKMKYGDAEIKMTKPQAEIVTSESHLRMVRSISSINFLADFEVIEADLRSKFTCTFDNNYLFYCYTGKESISKFPPIQIQVDSLTLLLTADDYVVFVISYNL